MIWHPSTPRGHRGLQQEGGYTYSGGFVLENIEQTALFERPKEIVVEKLKKALSPQDEIKELRK